jgi:phosphoribosylglycinamide formyltransferase-1
MENSYRIAVLASGSGTNLRALIEANRSGNLDADVVLVISNNGDSGALRIAEEFGISRLHLSARLVPEVKELDDAFLQAFTQHDIDLIALAGYMRQVPACVVRAYRGRILNIHPALLPAFGGQGMYGLKVHEAVLKYGCKISGVTVHLVDEKYDSGAPVLQRCVPVLPGDTPETLAARVLAEEHKIYAEAIQLFAEGRVEIDGRQVTIKGR